MARLATILGPEAVAEAIRGGRRIIEIYIAQGTPAAEGELGDLARGEGIPVRLVAPERLEQEAGGRTADGVVAYTKSDGYTPLGDLLESARSQGAQPLLLAVDLEEDPAAVGGLLRLVDAAGAHGFIVSARSAGITPAVAKAAKGSAERVKVARAANLAETLARLRDQGVRAIGIDPEGVPLAEAELTGPCVLAVPPEGHRLSPSVAAACDILVAAPFASDAVALPLAVTAGLVLYERHRQEKNAAQRRLAPTN